ncbi:MAG: RNA methyltransferase [Gammaproteobacteria bacterium]|nr:RNA methyltransferase [Gammaproteobacteria bacterium]
MKPEDSHNTATHPSIRIVLVETSHPGNIGAAARAMKNMGLYELALVSPKDFPAREADARCAGAHDILRQALIFDDLKSALVGCSYVVAASARLRTLPLPLLEPRAAAEWLASAEFSGDDRVAILFGRESSGLTNTELELSNSLLHIPTEAGFSSLNIAAAVQVVAYELFLAFRGKGGMVVDQRQKDGHEPAQAEEIERFFVHLEQTLQELEFIDLNRPGQLMRRLRRLFNRARLEKVELNILRGILSAAQKWRRLALKE